MHNRTIHFYFILFVTSSILLLTFYSIHFFSDVISSTQAHVLNDGSTPVEWIQNWTLRPPEGILLPGIPEQVGGESVSDTSVGKDGSIYIVSEISGGIYLSRRQSGSRGFDEQRRLNSPDARGILPRIRASDEDAIDVIWIGFDRDKGEALGPSIGHDLLWSHSQDGGDTWSSPFIMLTGNLTHPDLEMLPEGLIAVTVWYHYLTVDENDTVISDGFKLMYIAWTLDGRANFKRTVSELCPELVPEQFLFVSGDGNPHILVTENGTTNWYSSTDGGRSWQRVGTHLILDTDLGLEHGVLLGGVALSDDCLVYLISYQSVSNASRFYFGYGYNFKGWGAVPPPMNDRENFSTAFPRCSIQSQNGVAWFARLTCPDNKSASDIGGLSHAFLILQAIWFDKNQDDKRIMMDIDRIPIHGSTSTLEYNYLDVSISIENDNMAVISLMHPGVIDGTSAIDVWRFNHPPDYPEPRTVADGGWVYTPFVGLTPMSAMDIDGDDLEFRISYWMEGDGAPACSTWMRVPWIVIGVVHGTYHWSVEIRDPFNASTLNEKDWWFRVDTGPPSSDPGGPYLLTEGSTATLDGGGSADDGPLVLWEWDVDDDGAYDLNSTRATLSWRPPDDYSGLLALRVTDEAGRTAMATTRLWVRNVPPSIHLVGFSVVTGPSNFTAVVSDASADDIVQVRWTMDGGPVATGLTYEFVPDAPGVYYITAMATDDDGGSNYSFIKVSVPWPDGLPLSMEVPLVVVEGEPYSAVLSEPPPVWISPQDIIWRRGGVRAGTGTEVRFVAGTPGTESIEVGTSVDGRFVLCDATAVKVRERLRAVECLGAEVRSYDSVEVRWTAVVQPELFGRYVVRISRDPLARYPSPDLEWMTGPFDAPFAPVEITTRSATSHVFENLDSGWTYHICVYVVHGSEVSCSNSVSVSIPPKAGILNPGRLESDGEPILPVYVLLIAVLVLIGCVIAAMGIVLRRRRDGKLTGEGTG